MYTDIQTEGEAAVGLLLSSVADGQENLTQAHIETISRILVLCTRFRGQDMNEAFKKVFTIQQESDKNDFIVYCAALIKEDFADTLFTMCCETALADGSWKDSYGETLATIGIALQLSTEDIKMIIRTYIIRNRWNIQVEQ